MGLLGEENNIGLDWNQIDTILLDLDGTILDLNFDLEFWLEYVPKNYSKQNNISYERAKEIIISCLLYTSPSPRDGLLSRMPSSA